MTVSCFFAVDVDVTGAMGIPLHQSESSECGPKCDVHRASAAEADARGEDERRRGNREHKKSEGAVPTMHEREPTRLDEDRNGARSARPRHVEVQIAELVIRAPRDERGDDERD